MKARLLPAIIATCAAVSHAATLEIREGDHICLIGNTLAERMQFEGHNNWEAALHLRFPKHHLVVRNLAWPADEVVLRPRAEGFGTPDEHLAFCTADVVIAFFGFNESFAGEAGLEKFKTDLDEWIKHTKEQSYNGKSAPRIALVSPIAAEESSAGLQPAPGGMPPDGLKPPATLAAALNTHLELYTKAMNEVAERNGVVFADIFHPMLRSMGNSKHAETINGVHLNMAGDSEMSWPLDEQLFGPASGGGGVTTGDLVRDLSGSVVKLSKLINEGRYKRERLRREIEVKSRLWYHRYRIVDSYYVYGGRSGLKFADGEQTNRDVMEREREVLDVMCANRDERIWKLAHGESVPEKCDDSNAPPFLNVQTSFGVNQKKDAGKNTGQTSKTAEGSTSQIPSVAETLKKFTLAKGFKVECFASEEDFPELANATSMAFDTRGRLWVCTMPTYPQWRPGEEFRDKIIILEDSDGDGKANYCTTFADKLHLPISFEFYDGGILVSDQRNLSFLKDTNGDDRADVKEIVLSGFDSADSHHVINAFTYGPGGDLYFQEGTFHHTQVETPYGPMRCMNAGTYRYEPRTQELSVFVSYNYANPHGIAFDRWGQTFIADASGGMNYFATAFSGHLPYPDKHGAMQPFFTKRVRPTSGCEFVSSRNFPDAMQGNFLLNNCIGVQGTLNHAVKSVGSGYEGTEIEPLVLNSDPNFRPVDMEFGPDGALYIVDWAEALIGHMQYSIRDPLRDHTHGRIWRIWNAQKPLVQPAKIAGEPVEKLLELLKEPEQRLRERAKKELATRPTNEVMAAVGEWMKSSADDPHAQIEALWIHQWHNAVDTELLKRVLHSKQPEARAAGVRVLCYWRDRVPDALDLLRAAANDKHPLVRLEAVRACSFLVARASPPVGVAGVSPATLGPVTGETPVTPTGETPVLLTPATVALEVLKHDMDYYLTYTLGETMRALKPSPTDIDVKANPAALPYVLAKMSNDELKAAPPVEAVFVAQLERRGLDAVTRDNAATGLAKLRKSTREMEFALALMRLDDQQMDTPVSAEIGKLLAASPRDALKSAVETIQRLASKDHGVRSVRVAGMAAYVALLGDPVTLWKQRQDNHETLAVLLECVPLLSDPALRAKFHPILIEAITGSQPPQVRKGAAAALPLTGVDKAPAAFALLSDLMLKGQMRDTVAGAAMQLPRAAWDKARAQPVVESILAYAQKVPATRRTQQEYVEVAQFGMEMCALLPADVGGRLRKSLRELGVSVFVIKTVREQMRYDTPQIVVEAGKPFEVIFENNDIMPHNMVFCQPGTHTEIGTAAQTMPMVPDPRGYLYIPQHPGILANAFSKMLEPGQKARLQLTAPSEKGDYEYVCTFPGHWMIMFGKMIVVKDVDAHLQNTSAAAK